MYISCRRLLYKYNGQVKIWLSSSSSLSLLFIWHCFNTKQGKCLPNKLRRLQMTLSTIMWVNLSSYLLIIFFYVLLFQKNNICAWYLWKCRKVFFLFAYIYQLLFLCQHSYMLTLIWKQKENFVRLYWLFYVKLLIASWHLFQCWFSDKTRTTLSPI